MNIDDWVSMISAIAAVISAIAAVFWGRGLAAAKSETIKIKEAQIDTLRSLQEETLKVKEAQVRVLENQLQSCRELSPMKLREYVVSLKALAEERVGDLEEKLTVSRAVLKEKNRAIAKLRVEGEAKAVEIEQLEAEIDHLRKDQDLLTQQLRVYQETEKAATVLEGTFGKFTRVWNEDLGKWQVKFSMGDALVIGNSSEKPSV